MSEIIRNVRMEVKDLMRLNHRYSLISMNRQLKELSRLIEGQLLWKDLSKKFDCDKVKSLPTDVINLIKEFMGDELEYIRKTWCIITFFPSTIFEFDRTCMSLYFTSQQDTINCQNYLELFCKKIKKNKLYRIWGDDDLPTRTTKREICRFIANQFIDIVRDYKNNRFQPPVIIDGFYRMLRLLQIAN